MSVTLADQLDLPVAWRRVKYDLRHRAFLALPYEIELIEIDLEQWLAAIDQSIREDSYSPGPMVVCDVPKPGWLIRPGSHLSLVDRVVYTAAVGACYPLIHNALQWAQGVVDFGYLLAADPNNPSWLKSRYTGWQDFREMSKEILQEAQVTHAMFGDIAAYYENIDISLLMSDLRSIGADDEVLTLLSSCLNRWAQINGRGVPQGISASDILAKLYLNTVDLNLRAVNFRHLRYVDDIRLFADSEVTAKRGLLEVIKLLRRRGLNVQSAKTEVFAKEEALRDLEHVMERLNQVASRLVERIHEIIGADPYMSTREVDDWIARNPDDSPIEVVTEAYELMFSDPETPDFDGTIFHYLLGRLARANSTAPLDLHYTDFLRTHPEQTGAILDYAANIGAAPRIEERLNGFLASSDAIYSYQNYQIVHWMGRFLDNPSAATISQARRFWLDGSSPPYLKAVSRRIIAEHGSNADLERLENQYSDINSPTEQAELICSLRRMEIGRRNAFMRRVERDGEPQSRAVRWVRQQ
jgi:hypothetical protein